jgi:hypothetical protein
MVYRKVVDIENYFYVRDPEFSLLRKYNSAVLVILCSINFSSRDLIGAGVDVCEI